MVCYRINIFLKLYRFEGQGNPWPYFNYLQLIEAVYIFLLLPQRLDHSLKKANFKLKIGF